MERAIAPFRCGHRGLALIVVAGALAVLAVLATTFVAVSQMERRASAHRLAATRAVLLARSGLEDALARLASGQDSSLGADRYGGEDGDLSGGTLDVFESAQERYRPGTADVETCPPAEALRPSFAARSGSAPRFVTLDGRQRGWSGALSGWTYALKVEDESAKLNVNGGFLGAGDRDWDGSGYGGDGIPDFWDPSVASAPADPAKPESATGQGWNAQLVRDRKSTRLNSSH